MQPLRFLLCLALLAPFVCITASAQDEDPVFGTTVVLPFGLRGEIYELKQWSKHVPKPEKLKHLGTIYTASLNVTPREFSKGFPGVTDRFEWFAIDYTGHFYVANPGVYEFKLTSDDGSRLIIDGVDVINNDGMHVALTKTGTINLAGGIHRIRVPYFQGPQYHLALQLFVRSAGEADWRVFSTDEFKPPPHPEDWKYGSPDDMRDPPPARPSIGQKLKGVFTR